MALKAKKFRIKKETRGDGSVLYFPQALVSYPQEKKFLRQQAYEDIWVGFSCNRPTMYIDESYHSLEEAKEVVRRFREYTDFHRVVDTEIIDFDPWSE